MEETVTKFEKRESLSQFMKEIYPNVQKLVEQIEKSPVFSRNRYDAYMGALHTLSGNDKSLMAILAPLLVIAGGNEEGIKDALCVMDVSVEGRYCTLYEGSKIVAEYVKKFLL